MAWFVKTETFTAVAAALPLSSGDPPWRLTAIGFQRKLQQAAVYAAATWWMAIGVRAAGVC